MQSRVKESLLMKHVSCAMSETRRESPPWSGVSGPTGVRDEPVAKPPRTWCLGGEPAEEDPRATVAPPPPGGRASSPWRPGHVAFQMATPPDNHVGGPLRSNHFGCPREGL